MVTGAQIGLIVCAILMVVMVIACFVAPRKYKVGCIVSAVLFCIGFMISGAMAKDNKE
jgi:sugar phosphate permease